MIGHSLSVFLMELFTVVIDDICWKLMKNSQIFNVKTSPPNHWIQYFKSTSWYPTRGTQTRATPHWPVWSTISKMSNRNIKLYYLFWECGKTNEICRNHVKLFVQVSKTLHVCVYDLKKSIKMNLNFACINMLFYINIEYGNLEIQIILYRYIVFTFAWWEL